MILCQYFPAFKFLEDSVPAHLSHENTETMSRKSTVLAFPVLMKDQKKYSEVVDVLGQLEASKAMASFRNLVFAQFQTLIPNPRNSQHNCRNVSIFIIRDCFGW